jgi:hypothetical protein
VTAVVNGPTEPSLCGVGGSTMTRSSGHPRSLSLTFWDAGCLSLIRQWLRLSLPDGSDLELDAELVCCELVTNAVEHGGGFGVVRIDVVDETQVRVEVDDHDPNGALTVGHSRLGAYRGRGLTIVNSFARWGITRTGTGKTIWAAF